MTNNETTEETTERINNAVVMATYLLQHIQQYDTQALINACAAMGITDYDGIVASLSEYTTSAEAARIS